MQRVSHDVIKAQYFQRARRTSKVFFHILRDTAESTRDVTATPTIASELSLRLFAKEPTEYDLLADVQKSFEPYCDLWKRVDDWMNWHKGWMNDSFLSLDAEEVTRSVSALLFLRVLQCHRDHENANSVCYVWLVFFGLCCIVSETMLA